MNKQQLFDILAKHGLKIDTDRITTGTAQGGFHTFECGTGAPVENIVAALHEIKPQHNLTALLWVDNLNHPQHGEAYLCVSSFWCGEDKA